ncbi:hypothetical protein KPH14_003237 [Odynerus spinipes]|uniref:Peptidase S1 domain-containing protein n=1 Tax=Odynerus spinipes TaxID=1348599 RepID=A0AAD9RGJ7_9HYME|nr:hypothetical protein KPH14_003237 [Odynerus spinipes]
MLRSFVIIFAALAATCLGASVRLTPPLPINRIVGGQDANVREHPHQASLAVYGHLCGASIINKRWLISAAHCVGLSADYYSISVGSNSTSNGTKYAVKKVVKHPLYNSQMIDYDASLIQVEGEIEFNDFVKPIKLASSEPSAGFLVNVTGWGKLSEGGKQPGSLQVVSVPIVNRTACQKAYEYEAEITQSMICAGYDKGGKDSCQGDSGGPLTANGVLYGIVSWGFGCARPKYPGVYTNVAKISTWAKIVSSF